MKTFRPVILLALIAGFAGHASAAVYTSSFNTGFANGGVIPDGNVTGWSDTRTLSGIADLSITDVNVSLTIAGGYTGDFYAYLTHSSGFSVLLNRAGATSANPFGYSDAGLNVTLDDSAANGDIHTYQTVIGFSTLINNGSAWSPDGRNVNPLFAVNTVPQTALLNQFNALDPNGTWTLFIADVSGGAQGAVVGWGLNITALPEPSSLCLMMLGALVMLRKKLRA